MDNRFHIGHLVRDMVIGFALAILLPLTFYWVAQVIHPEPSFNDFACKYKDMDCAEAEKKLKSLKKQLEELNNQYNALVVLPSPESARRLEIDKQRKQLDNEIETMDADLKKAHKVQTEEYSKAINSAHTTRVYLGMVVGLVALLLGLLAPMLPVQIGFTVGGVLIILFSYIIGANVVSNFLKLISLVIAILFLVAMSFKFHRKSWSH